ncbi:FAD-dependent monooxygenase [Dysgonomonas sp. Marseille-P4677]|uniref:NAD(P)/FAD-dependent oxidoreductase n=1 Tax=Dysgonomonas sp. Marseille-P4677 TaxID=2364790 RepID=UPI0019144790|nr:FAD-dependent monooxygenase [Dysgonomonas sp. Marseille-P4677]MBK5720567.1 FAD-dependent monooxygenase [Dysgonomonas sp. Marseille-P4677]
MQKDLDLRITPEQASDMEIVKKIFSSQSGIPIKDINSVRILRRSIDARQRNIYVNLKVRGYIDEVQTEPDFTSTYYPNVKDSPQAIIVGAGPAGLFAALRLIELGIRPIVIERGKNVRDRKRDTALMNREHLVNPESNYCFGEGGAGAYSDGKLYTRSKKRGSVEKILNVFCQHGAEPSILIDAHPHIGTDRLPGIIEKMRVQIIMSGGEVHFQTRMDKLIIKDNQVKGIETNTGEIFLGQVILATGHSARDVYYMLYDQKIKIEAKGLAVGFRVEHSSHLIDQIQYHCKEGRGEFLPAAEYSFVVQAGGRGVYSFCMCPGGTIVPSASGPKQVVVNGMSPSNRGSRWSNSGVVVEIHPEDFAEYAKYNELSLLKFVEDLEELAWIHGGKTQVAPAQRLYDFVNGKQSDTLPDTSYSPGVVSSPMHQWMPKFVSSRLQEAFKKVGNSYKGYLTNDAILLGVESRTSSPVRILRDRETMQHIEIKGLYPCGEGAGYAGGIVSAAMDGERCAEALAEEIMKLGN